MKNHQRNHYTEYRLPDNPIGWYQLCLSQELHEGMILQRHIAGHEVVVYRTQSGKACIIDPYCPHLGAHFLHGGRVEGEELICPFHGFRFNEQGHCVKTAYGSKPPPRSKVYHWPVQEVNGFVFVFYHPHAEQPHFQLPEWDEENWTPVRSSRFALNGHPQETTENSVDIGHFATVHQYTDIEEVEPMSSQGAYLTATYKMKRKTVFLGYGLPAFEVRFQIHVYGLGYSFVRTTVANYGIETRHFVLTTPLGAGRIDLCIGSSTKYIQQSSSISPWLRFIPSTLLTGIIDYAIFQSYRSDVLQDYDIWNNKIHIVPPILAKGDGPVGRYRRWAKQFYVHDAEQQDGVTGKKSVSSLACREAS